MKVVIVMCPDDHCLTDVQVRVPDDEDVVDAQCERCGIEFELRLPSIAWSP